MRNKNNYEKRKKKNVKLLKENGVGSGFTGVSFAQIIVGYITIIYYISQTKILFTQIGRIDIKYFIFKETNV